MEQKPKKEYNVYSKLTGNNLEKLNLTICENTKISKYFYININKFKKNKNGIFIYKKIRISNNICI